MKRELGKTYRLLVQPVRNWQTERHRIRVSVTTYRNLEMYNPGAYYSLNAFDYYKCIFVHIPKTAGISISTALFGNYAGGHHDINWYQRYFPEPTFKRYFKFAFVRNPWDRLFSAYHFLKKGGFHDEDKKWFGENLAHFRDFDDFVCGWLTRENVNRGIVHFRPQIDFIRGSSGNIMLDFVARYEKLATDFEIIKRRIGSNASLPRLNVSTTGGDFRSHFTSETARIVGEVYRADIEAFGYTFGKEPIDNRTSLSGTAA